MPATPDEVLGPGLIGLIFGIVLYGVTCAQVTYYCARYCARHRDELGHVKRLVAILWVLDTATTTAAIVAGWDYLVTMHASASATTILVRAVAIEYLFGVCTDLRDRTAKCIDLTFVQAIVTLIAQCCYMYSICRLTMRKWYCIPLTITMLMSALTSCACGIASAYIGFSDHEMPGIFVKTKTTAVLQILAATVTDLYITISLTLILRGHRTGFRNTEAMINKLTVYIINRGILTTLIPIGQTIAYTTAPVQVTAWAAFHVPGSKVYVNSLIAMINARGSINQRQTVEDHLTTMFFEAPPPSQIALADSRRGAKF
ncbi:hypothetical protein WOLCODRAFT_143220 [Wolfiporia cocos MD-104 SS10]|uniref:DUF6534 domain-containing protein n=1 Tax=Wolfiporia cocos (strain MD-104) TaxID=742152 RepID=A0A2H3JFU7_WOLCO|nr:hypothetical protein WOLCODRAFT_143220 [Wolfiporia cocos MD-104 SS10]